MDEGGRERKQGSRKGRRGVKGRGEETDVRRRKALKRLRKRRIKGEVKGR